MEGIDGVIIHTAGLHLGFFGSSFRLVGRLSGGLDGLRRGGGLVGLCQQVAVGEAQHPDHEDAQHQQPDKQLFHIVFPLFAWNVRMIPPGIPAYKGKF